MMSVVYVESSSTVLVLLANILATIAPCVSCSSKFSRVLLRANYEYSDWQVRTLFSHGMKLLAYKSSDE